MAYSRFVRNPRSQMLIDENESYVFIHESVCKENAPPIVRKDNNYYYAIANNSKEL